MHGQALELVAGWLIMNPGGGPTPDKPDISVVNYEPGNSVSSFLNLRVANIQECYDQWSAKGAEFVTPPIDRGAEIRCYMRDPDGYLIEVGQATGSARGQTRQEAARRPAGLGSKRGGECTMSLSRYGKRADLIVHEQEPFNAESGLAALAEGPLTATDAFYVRGHGPVPDVDRVAWRLRVHGLVERELDLSLTTLREAFRERTVTATLQCAGNRRAGLMAIRDIPARRRGSRRDRHRDVGAGRSR